MGIPSSCVFAKGPAPSCRAWGPRRFPEIIGRPRGIIIVTGTTGSGKTTTLGGAIDQINSTQSHKIITLEDPIEIRHENRKSIVKHRELGRHFQSFPEAIRAAMRQDPDIILLGELRDPETMSAALTAAETGHLVFATAHTKDAAGCVSRVLDALPVPTHWRPSLVRSWGACPATHSGTDGKRVAAFELLINTQAVRNCIREKRIDHIRDEIGRNSTRAWSQWITRSNSSCARAASPRRPPCPLHEPGGIKAKTRPASLMNTYQRLIIAGVAVALAITGRAVTPTRSEFHARRRSCGRRRPAFGARLKIPPRQRVRHRGYRSD
ncbi:type IV pilus twitching motility protein PilT (plasmid) [Termitidicoccus mucosus]|uniref:type IV pilus twitching motility protein PilT n=1 Tax=Termitidicoccus mucosus TaxID=1184151 RepID=UPI00318307F5